MPMHQQVSVPTEVDFWASHGVNIFKLQYSNQFQIGIEESTQIQNALGVVWLYRIKTISSMNLGTLWTTDYMYASLQNDFSALGGSNMSLVQNSSTYFGLIDDNMMEENDVCTPLTAIFQAVHDQIGPMDNIDLYWIPMPMELLQSVQTHRSNLLVKIQSDEKFNSSLSALGAYTFHITPLKWQNSTWLFYGGNPMCGFGVGLPFVQESFGFDDGCATQNALSINWSPFSVMFAYAMVNGNVSSTCKELPPVYQSLCMHELAKLSDLYARYSDTFSVPPLPSIERLQLSFLQFIDFTGGTTLTIEQQLLLEPSFAFFGWISIYEWALNMREAVSFEGDTAIYPLMSYASKPLSSRERLVQSSVSVYFWYSSCILNIGLFGVGTLTFILWLLHRPDGCPWFVFNRIVSAAWLNRSIILVRGLTAILCLSSATIEPDRRAANYKFVGSHRSIIDTCLFAGEATWIMYMMQEALHPFTSNLTRIYAPCSTVMAWIVLVALDIWMPAQATSSLDRSCLSKNMDQMVYCISGTIHIGSLQRTLVIFGVLIASSIVSWVLVSILRPKEPPTKISPSLVLCSAAVAFLQSENNFDYLELDFITAAMCGVLRLKLHKLLTLFDTKLWVPLPKSVYFIEPERAIMCLNHVGTNADMVTEIQTWRKSFSGPKSPHVFKLQFNFLVIGIGIMYTIMSLVSNVTYLTIARASLANDYGWAGFNSTGMHTFIANIFNTQLLVSTSQLLDLSSNAISDFNQLYNGTGTSVVWSPNAPRRQLYNASVPLESIIQGLRQMNPCMLPWMFTQYCYLDFGRIWTMASNTKRQIRCKQYTNNAAVYLEAPLRNMQDWDVWQRCWGTSFDIGFAQYLQTTQQGRTWLTSVQSNTNSIDDEVALWKQHGITMFQLQWQNYKTMGMTDYFTITSAMGYTSPLTLSNFAGNYHVAQQTSMRMYWTFASDLWGVSTNVTWIGGKSLLVDSPLFAFANVSSEVLLYQNLTLIQPLNAGLLVLRSTLGPFGCIDMKFLSPPTELSNLYAQVLAAVNGMLLSNISTQVDYFKIPRKPRVCEIPPYLLSDPNIQPNGGNIMCGNDVPYETASYGLLSGFGSTNVCFAEFLEKILAPTIEVLFAVIGFNLTHGPIMNGDFDGICGLDMCAGATCASGFNTTHAFLQRHINSFTSLQSLFLAAELQIQQLNIQTIQYYTLLNDTTTTFLYHINILEPTERLWTFYGWCLSFEWANGVREVVQFIGDEGSMTSITYQTPPISMTPDPTEIPVSFASAFLGCTFYITWILICIAGLVTMYSIAHRGHIEGMNLFELNRIVGHVWAGRTFLVIRSITAIWILNTAPLNLVQVGQATHLTSPQLPWYQTILAASEVTWLVYALNDMFSFVTQQYTTYYAYKSSLSTWCVISAWSLLSPLTYSAALHRECSYVDMDFGLVCVSGSIEVGRTRGVLGVMGVATLCVIASYLVERLCFAPKSPLEVRSLLLNSQCIYMLNLGSWHFNNEYFLDKTSAVMAGLISFEYKGELYILDIKSWRMIIVPVARIESHIVSAEALRRFHWSIPLHRI
ncbi:hypothetical protein THRCLA_09378 [Thraustotheca clavata]|uniref:Uncharacterized protein n=1 Tax=Thraustotheca clavata TaxID=74557 RepID=A0A1V9YX20_9STRA|nr:hypothetical protein THRCLA_09378 [Thraustotheca clavata]